MEPQLREPGLGARQILPVYYYDNHAGNDPRIYRSHRITDQHSYGADLYVRGPAGYLQGTKPGYIERTH